MILVANWVLKTLIYCSLGLPLKKKKKKKEVTHKNRNCWKMIM